MAGGRSSAADRWSEWEGLGFVPKWRGERPWQLSFMTFVSWPCCLDLIASDRPRRMQSAAEKVGHSGGVDATNYSHQ
jgi:hypothetical protein